MGRGVGGGNGLAQTDDGERILCEFRENYKNFGGIICHVYVSRRAGKVSLEVLRRK